MSRWNSSAVSRSLCCGPTRMGAMIRASAASTAPAREDWSHGWTTAQVIGGTSCVAAMRRSYFSCRLSDGTLARSPIVFLPGASRRRCCSLLPAQEEPDLAEIAIRIGQDLGPDLVAQLLQVTLIEI